MLVDDVPLPERPDTGHARHVDRVRPVLVSQVGRDRLQVGRLWREHLPDGEVKRPVAAEEPAGVHEGFRLAGKAEPVGAVLRAPQFVVRAGDQLRGAGFEKFRVEFFGWLASGAGAEDVAAHGVAVGFGQPPPAPALDVPAFGVEAGFEVGLDFRIAGGEEHLHRRPRHLVIVVEEVPVVGDLLIRSVPSVFGDGPLEEIPALFRGGEVFLRFLGIGFFENRRRGGLGERGDRRGRGGRVLGIDDLRVPLVRRHVVLVFPVPRIDEEEKPAVVVLHLHQEIRLPLRHLDDVADAVAALGNAEVVEFGHAGERVCGEDQVVDEARGIDRVFAVIAGVVVPAAHVHLPGFDDRVEAVGGRLHDRRGVLGIFGRIGARALDVLVVRGFRRDDLRRCGVRRTVGEARERLQRPRRPIFLVINPQRIRAGHQPGPLDIDPEWQRRAHTRHGENVMARLRELRKIRREHVLVGRLAETDVRPRRQVPFERLLPGRQIHQRKLLLGDRQFPGASEIIPGIPELRPGSGIGVLIDVERGVEPPGLGARRPRFPGKNDPIPLARHLHFGPFRHRGRQLQEKPVPHAQVPDFQRRVEDPALETHRFHRHRLPVYRHSKIHRHRPLRLLCKIPDVERRVRQLFPRHPRHLEPFRRNHPQPVIPRLRELQRRHFGRLRTRHPRVRRQHGTPADHQETKQNDNPARENFHGENRTTPKSMLRIGFDV